MKKKLYFILFLIISNLIFSEEQEIKSMISLDLGYTRIGLENNGWGLGVGYEKMLIDHLAGKFGFGHMTFKTNVEKVYCTTVNISMLANYYFLSSNLRKLYFGAGMSTDFLNYFGPGVIPDRKHDTIIYINSILGWKHFLLPYLLLDVSTGYNFIINNAENYPSFSKYGKGGFQYSISLKLLKH